MNNHKVLGIGAADEEGKHLLCQGGEGHLNAKNQFTVIAAANDDDAGGVLGTLTLVAPLVVVEEITARSDWQCSFSIDGGVNAI
jgi:hypothetical protein